MYVEGKGFEPLEQVSPLGCLANSYHRPLGQPSINMISLCSFSSRTPSTDTQSL